VLRFIPEEEKLSFSAMTSRSLYYLADGQLAHKVLSIAEEEGVSDASYALKILQSEGKLTIASTAKESKTGRLSTQSYEVTGPVALILTTTAIDVDEELMNRCIVLAVDEGREQTQAIHAVQRRRKTLEGLLQAAGHDALVAVHHNVQRLLRPLHVVIPQADELTYTNHALRTRRDHQKYLGLIQAVTLLMQHQRDVKEADLAGVKVRYIEATDGDVKVATTLAHAILGRSLDDMAPGTRRLLGVLHEHVTELAEKQGLDLGDVRFTRRDLREHLSFGDTQLKIHIRRLVDMEFLVVHRGGEGRRLAYELAYQGEGKDGEKFLAGLSTTASGRGSAPHRSGSGRASVGPRSAGGRGAQLEGNPVSSKGKSGSKGSTARKGSIGTKKNEGDHSRTAGSH